MIKIYQVKVKGPMRDFAGMVTLSSRRVFLEKAAAEKYVPEFHEKCLTGGNADNLFALEEIMATRIVELELMPEQITGVEFKIVPDHMRRKPENT